MSRKKKRAVATTNFLKSSVRNMRYVNKNLRNPYVFLYKTPKHEAKGEWKKKNPQK